jgi:6-pyruvoyltetrahydropterin/6-carboxytetrahydropterin synthase
MFQVTKEIHFCYGHRLLDYDGKCRYFHGHNGKLEVQLSAETLDAKGMVRDFTEIKTVLQTWVNEELDHRMLLNARDPMKEALRAAGEPIVLMESNPTAENIAKLIYDTAKKKGLPVTSVTLWETPNSFATYKE